ncbi:MAG: OmpH family outer membrane protein [Rhodanobacteraceae bacterium]
MTRSVSAGSWVHLLLVASAIGWGGLAAAQSIAGKVGYVDMKRLLDNAPQVIASRQKLEREFASRDADLKADEARLAGLRAAQQKTAGDGADTTENDARKREIDALDRSIKRNRETLRAELKSRSDQELDRSWRDINNAVVEFARDNGYDLIVPSPVVYASARVDITDQVLERLKRDYRPADAQK